MSVSNTIVESKKKGGGVGVMGKKSLSTFEGAFCKDIW